MVQASYPFLNCTYRECVVTFKSKVQDSKSGYIYRMAGLLFNEGLLYLMKMPYSSLAVTCEAKSEVLSDMEQCVREVHRVEDCYKVLF